MRTQNRESIMAVLYLNEDEVATLLTMELALEATEAAFRKLALDEAVNVPRQRCQTDRVMLHLLPAAAKTIGVLGYKAYTVTKETTQFRVFLHDGRTGALIAILDADALGQYRTGAASGIATRKLARTDAATVGLYGTGKQARTQLLAICKVRPITSVHVYGRDDARRKAFAAQLAQETGVEVVPVERPEDAARGRDIIITATSAREPILQGEWVGEGTHINLVGSNFLAKCESDVEVFRKATCVVVDSKDQAKMEAGDFVKPVEQGVLHWADICDLAPLLVGRYPGRESPSDVTIFKSLGLGIEDVVLAAKLLPLARERGLGREIL